MKSSLGKLGRKLSINRSDGKEKRDHQPSAHFEELAQVSKDMQDMRNCYDSLIGAAAATANSIYEFSESLNEMGTCLLDKTTVDANDESGRVLSALGNMQSELQKVADTYRSNVIKTVTNPAESLLNELRKVEEMKLQCDEKREVYEYLMMQHREKGKVRSGKVENSVIQKLREAHDEYDEAARLCVFRVKSLKEGQSRSLLTQAARHHAAQINFFRKGLKTLEAVDPYIRTVAEKHRIDYQLSGLSQSTGGDGEGSYESSENGELSFDYRQRKPNLVELDVNKYKGEQFFGKQARVSSYSAPLYPEKTDTSVKKTQPSQKFYSYVLPHPVVDAKIPIPRTPIQSVQPNEKHERDTGDDKASTSAPASKDGNTPTSSVQLPAPSTERFSFSGYDGSKSGKRQAYSGPLPPSKTFSGKMAAPASGRRMTTTELPRVPTSRSVSPPTLLSPKISELHELPRPPSNNLPFSKAFASPSGLNVGHSAPLFFKNQETPVSLSVSPPNKSPIRMSTSASPLPPPPLVVPRSFSIPSSDQRGMAIHVAKLMESQSPQISGKPGEVVASPPLTPISLANIKSLGRI